jgi:TetR/AcrR family transcriptional repressor of uid operon
MDNRSDMKPKRHQDPEIAQMRRDQVLAAAADCFRRRGYHGAAMAEVARTAGMSPGHIYNYFESKEEIIEAIVARDVEEMMSILGELQARPGPLVDAMVEGVQTGVDKNLDLERGALQLEMLAEAARNPKVAAALRESDAQARSRLRALLTGPEGTLREAGQNEVDGRIELLAAMFGGLAVRAVVNPGLDRAALIAIMRPVMRLILTQGPSR